MARLIIVLVQLLVALLLLLYLFLMLMLLLPLILLLFLPLILLLLMPVHVPGPAHFPLLLRRAARALAPATLAAPPIVRGRARGGGSKRRHGIDADPNLGDVPCKTYRDPGVGNQLPEVKPSRPVGMHFGQPLLRHSMRNTIDFFGFFFTVEMVNNICIYKY